MEISFIILHYNSLDDTIKCIESIRNLKTKENESVSIIVVDNCSPNGTGCALKEQYKGIERIDIVLLDKNRGFACGNNAGYVYAKEKYNPDFIILSNNDIVIEQKDFIPKIIELYRIYHFSVLGPDIYAPYKGIHQNPLRKKAYNCQEIEKMILSCRKKIKLLKLSEKLHCYSIVHGIKRTLKKKIKTADYMKEMQSQVVLHGALLILSSEYIDAYPSGLYDKTFMYMEEDFLYYMCQRKGLKMIYSPELQVIHNEGAATRSALKSRVKKSIFEMENTIQSAYLLLDFLNSDDK